MKRLFMITSSMFLCAMLAGCSADSYEGLISQTINQIGLAATDVDAITKKVNEAVKKVNDGTANNLDLTAAGKAATEQLKKTGEELQKIKRRIEEVRSSVSEEDRKKYANESKERLNTEFKNLLKNKEELRNALDAAEKLNKNEVDALRKKIVEAEGPFEALTRQ